MSEDISRDRRRFLAAVGTLAAARIGTFGAARAAEPGKTRAARPRASGPATSFASLKQIDAGELNVGYAEAGPVGGPAVLLLHGWPYDIHSFVDVAPMLAAAGYRVIVPHLRGHGTTRFLSRDAFRNAQQSVVALDIVALMDALEVELLGSDAGSHRGSFDNPDHVSIVIHNYRWRLSLAEGDPRYDELERRLAQGPVIGVPTITLDGDSDGVAPASDETSYARKFSGKRTHRVVKGVGHNLPQEAQEAFADAVVEVDRH